MALWQKTVAPFSEHKGGVGSFLKIPRSNSVVILGNFLHCRVWSLYNQLLLQFSMDHFETMHTCCGYIEDVHVNFCRRKNNF